MLVNFVGDSERKEHVVCSNRWRAMGTRRQDVLIAEFASMMVEGRTGLSVTVARLDAWIVIDCILLTTTLL